MTILLSFFSALSHLASAMSWGAQCPLAKDTAESYFLVSRTEEIECGRRDRLDTLLWALGIYPKVGNRIETVSRKKADKSMFTAEEVQELYGVEFTRFTKQAGGSFLCLPEKSGGIYAISKSIGAYPAITEVAPKFQLTLGFDEFGVLAIGSKRSGMSLSGITMSNPLLPGFLLRTRLLPASAPTRTTAWDPKRLSRDADFARKAQRCTTAVVDSFILAHAEALRADHAAKDAEFVKRVAGVFPMDSAGRSKVGKERVAVGEMLAEQVLREAHRQLALPGKCQVRTSDEGSACAGVLYTHGRLVRGVEEMRSLTVFVSRGADIGTLDAGIDRSGKVTLGAFRPLIRWTLDSATRVIRIDTGTWDVRGTVKPPEPAKEAAEDDGATPEGMPLPLRAWFFAERNAQAWEVAKYDPYPQLYRINELTQGYPRKRSPDLSPSSEDLLQLHRRRIRSLLR